jgi:hypothetical protein
MSLTFVNPLQLEYLSEVPVLTPTSSRLCTDIQALSEEIDINVAKIRNLNPQRLDYSRVVSLYDSRIERLRSQRQECLGLLDQSDYQEEHFF